VAARDQLNKNCLLLKRSTKDQKRQQESKEEDLGLPEPREIGLLLFESGCWEKRMEERVIGFEHIPSL
jgi:hypothetical protein